MTKRLVTILVVSVLAALLLTSFAFARASFDSQRAHEERLKQMKLYSFPNDGRNNAVRVSDMDTDVPQASASTFSNRVSVGASVAANPNAGGPGITVDESYDDYQSGTRSRHVDFWGTPDIQFAYNDIHTATFTGAANPPPDQVSGYNVYNPVAGNWPRGLGLGCEVQSPGDYGTVVGMAVTPKGRIVLVDQEPWLQSDNHFYYQAVATPYSCTWGLGVAIPKSSYKTWRGNPADTAPELLVPVIDLQIIGTDTVTHVAARWNGAQALSAHIAEYPILYYRKLGQTGTGTWVGPTVIDSARAYFHLASSRVNSKVAICFMRRTAEAISRDTINDEVECFRESQDGGLTWGPRTECHPTNRSVPSITPWVESMCLYDTDGNLHVVFNAEEVPANPYGTSVFNWALLRNGSNIYHYYQPTGTLSLIYNATWPDITNLCGWMGYNALTTANFHISECAGRIYAFWSMANDLGANAPGDDCASGGVPSAGFAGNGDIFMSVSNDKTGLLWDAPRNITKTYTPNCDSLTGHGICYNEWKSWTSRYGMDSSAFGSALIFPETSLTLGGTRSNDSAIQMFYIEDHYPGQYALTNPYTFVGTVNPLKYTRISCVTPITAPRIRVSPLSFGYPSFVKYGASKNHTITVENQGNASLSVANNEVVKTTFAAQNWLTVSASTMTIPAASSSTFDLTITATPFFTAGTVYSLTGQVKVHNNTPTIDSVKIITIDNYLIADTVVGLTWDTVSTTCTKLVVSSNGDMGRLGLGRVNLDYVGFLGDCVDSTRYTTHDVYLYSGGPMVIKQTGPSAYVFSSALFQADYATTQAFKNITGGPAPVGGSNATYDSFYTSNMVNRDTSIVLNRTYYAPKQADSCPFVIARTRYIAKSVAQSNVLLSEIVDFDVPGNGGSDNKSGISAKGFVYQRGTDSTAAQTLSCTDSARWAAVALLGYYSKSELVADSCANHASAYGAYAQLNDSVFKYDTASENVEGGYFWNKATNGYAATTLSRDHHSALTVVKGQTISTTDTFFVYTVVTTVKQGTLTDLESNFEKAKCWYSKHLRHCSCGCCIGTVGNCDGDPTDGVDIGDLTALIDNLFISFTPLICPAEGNCDGDPSGNVDIGDLTALIDNLFISFAPLPACH